ncbi:hypothetical protein FOZ60_016517 [Perkinsus olseni]|uniref:FHA domain-containing protein n=1 Tax=Perkinsus olseni TaxID=32597 RepID=A0A7J6P435_PEROL|nr:hypothetical protein FOZ60_016517 [Perkinsus olseni]
MTELPRFILVLSSGSSPSSSSKPLTKPGEVLTMGRIPDCDIVFKSNAISGNHCSLAYLDGGIVRLTDTSFNGKRGMWKIFFRVRPGTYVNGELVGKGKIADIKSGDRIGLGRPMVNTKATRQGQKSVSFLVEYTAKFVDPPGVSTAPSPSRLRASSAPILEDNKKDPLTTKTTRPLSAVVPRTGKRLAPLCSLGLEVNTSMKTPQQYPAVRHIKTEQGRAGAAPARPAVAPQAMASSTRIDGDKRRVSIQQPSKDGIAQVQTSQTPVPTSAKSKERPRRQQQQQPSSTRSLVGDSDNRRSFGLSRKDSNGKASAVPPDSALPSSGSCWLCPKRKEREESLVTETKALRARLASREGELATLEERLQESELTMTLKKAKANAQTEVMSTKEALSSLQEAHAELKARCEGLVNAAKKSKTDREALVEKLNAVEARANSTESELIYCQEQAHGLQQNLDQECEHSRSLSAELQHSREHCAALKADLQEALGKLQRVFRGSGRSGQAQTQVLNHRASLQSEVDRLNGDLDKARDISSSGAEVARALAGAIRDGLKAFEGHSFPDLPATRAPPELPDISPVKLRSTELVGKVSLDFHIGSFDDYMHRAKMRLPPSVTPPYCDPGPDAARTPSHAIAQRDNSTSSIDGVSLGSAASERIRASQQRTDEGSVTRAMDTQEQLEGVGGTQMMWTEEADVGEEGSKEAQLPATAGMLQPTADVPEPAAALDDDEFADFPDDMRSLGQENSLQGGTFDDLAEFDIDALPGRAGGNGQEEEGAFSDDFADFDLSQHPARTAAERGCNDSLLADLDLDDTFSSLSAGKPQRAAAHQAQTDGLNGPVDDLADFDDF